MADDVRADLESAMRESKLREMNAETDAYDQKMRRELLGSDPTFDIFHGMPARAVARLASGQVPSYRHLEDGANAYLENLQSKMGPEKWQPYQELFMGAGGGTNDRLDKRLFDQQNL